MRAEVSTLFGLNVYTDKGVYIGKVNDVVLEPNESKISGLAVGNVNKELFDVSSNGIILPFRWVIAVGDIILTRQISTKIIKKSDEEEEEESD